ncbi:DUF5337 family protein [Paracoccaceae bacterium GXU_MW_L88]
MDKSGAYEVRRAAIVIAAAFTLWVVVNLLGGVLGIPPRYAFLADLAAMAAMIWALIVVLKVRADRRRTKEGHDA